jgi:hypothetical protein
MDNWTLFVVLLVVAALAVVFLRKRKPAELEGAHAPAAPASQRSADAPATYQPLSALASSQAASAPSNQPVNAGDPDQQVLEQLRAAGSDLSKPHEMEFYLYFPSEQAAEQAGLKLETEGFDGEVRSAPDRNAWLCLVYRQMVPERAKLAALRKRFNMLTRELGGEYDGWETKIEN